MPGRMDASPLAPDTIAAAATARGQAAVALVRISGPAAREVLQRVFRRHTPGPWRSHQLYRGVFVAPASGVPFDDGLACLMAAPRSYTGEDVVELHGHGGRVVAEALLLAAVQAGCRLAEPGEFTRRAFFHGRLDLTQAEAVADLIEAPTRRAAELALRQARGLLAATLSGLRERVTDALVALEVALDFADSDVEPPDRAGVAARLAEVLADVRALLRSAPYGRRLREGFRVVLLGKPNVGKSSLFNALLGQARAIVHERPGTTRDYLVERLELRGMPIELVDTAGLRPTRDVVEAEGILRSRQQGQAADLLLLLIAQNEPLDPADRALLAEPWGVASRVVLTKADRPSALGPAELAAIAESPAGAGGAPLPVSVRGGAGLDALLAMLVRAALADAPGHDEAVVVSNVRHALALESMAEALARATQTLAADVPLEFAAADLRDALAALGEVTGATTAEDVLNRVFERFCIGK